MTRTILTYIMIFTVALAGCQAIYDQWPTAFPKDAIDYAGAEPNNIGWPAVRKLKDLREQCITKNIITQSNLAQQMSLDQALYSRAIDQANLNIQIAEAERQQIVGTIQSPGWLLSFLLPAAGGLAGRAITQLTHYSEAELQAELKKRSGGKQLLDTTVTTA